MKRLGITLFICLIGYALFYDITVGTLTMLTPKTEEVAIKTAEEKSVAATKATETTETNATYQQVEIKSGDTVLSIVEAINKKNKLPSLETITKDFQNLNNNESPSKLRIGKRYKFPVYK